MSDRAIVTAVTAAARTATGNTAALATPPVAARLAVLMDCTASGGVSPSMTLSVEWSHDGATFAAGDPADAFAAIVAAAAKAKDFAVKGDYFRLKWDISGASASFTFSATVCGV